MRLDRHHFWARRQFLRWMGAAGASAGAARLAGAALAGGARTTRAPASGPEEVSGGAEVLRLDANENPYGPSPAALRALEEWRQESHRYPIAERELLIAALARRHGTDRACVLPGCGSTELLRAAVAGLGGSGAGLLLAEPTYEDPVEYGQPFRIRLVRVPLDSSGVHDLERMERALRGGPRLVYVCNPNNPTGTFVPGDALERFVRAAARRASVLVDEAYHDYATDPRYASMMPLALEGLPVVVTRTFSKIHGMAGLRLGYAVGPPALLEKIAPHLTFAGASLLAARAGLASLEDADHLERCRRDNATQRERLSAALVARGYPVFASQTNFVMFRLGSDVRPFIAEMKERGVRVGRPFPPYGEHCRVTRGTAAQIDRFLEEFDAWRQAAAA
jgi:histidinol-phosphate aminotransferase